MPVYAVYAVLSKEYVCTYMDVRGQRARPSSFSGHRGPPAGPPAPGAAAADGRGQWTVLGQWLTVKNNVTVLTVKRLLYST